MQIRDIARLLEMQVNGLKVLDIKRMESEGYVTRSRLGPPKPRTPWYQEGKVVTSKEFKAISKLLADISQLTLVPSEEYPRIAEFEKRYDYTDILKEIRDVVTHLLITFIEHHNVRSAKMRIFDDMQVLIKETWNDIERIMFRTAELSDLFKKHLKELRISFNDLLPTYRESEDVHLAMSIETSYQANLSMSVGTCFLACLLQYNDMLKQSGAKNPSLRFQKDYRKKHPGEKYFLSDKFIEDLALTAYILNMGLYHSSLDTALQRVLTQRAPSEDEHREIRKKTYETTHEIIEHHTILDLPVGKSMLRALITGEMGEDTGGSTLTDPIIIEMLKVCLDYFSLTSQRPYRSRFNRSHVIEYIGTQLGATYNIEAADIFFNLLHPYAPGEILTLNDSKTNEPKYLVKVLSYTSRQRHPQARSMPIVRVLQSAEGAPRLDADGSGIVNLVQIHHQETNFEEEEIVFMGTEEQGAFFLAEVTDPSIPRVRLLRCVTRAIPKEKSDPVIDKLIDVPPNNPQNRRLWKCHASLYLADTVPSQQGDIFQ